LIDIKYEKKKKHEQIINGHVGEWDSNGLDRQHLEEIYKEVNYVLQNI